MFFLTDPGVTKEGAERSSKVLQGSYLEELPDWSADSDVPAPRLRMAAAPENICPSGCTLGMLERERERSEEEVKRAQGGGFLKTELNKRRGGIVTVQGHFFTRCQLYM